jgi:hypothetical protein
LQNILRNIFENILWPAAAGNVVWSFLSVAFEASKPITVQQSEACWLFVQNICWFPGPEIGASHRLLILFVFSVYLTIAWLQLRAAPPKITYTSWVFEGLHLFALTACAVAAYMRPAFLETGLFVYFVVTITGHAFYAWNRTDSPHFRRWPSVLVNTIGLSILVIGKWLDFGGDLRVSGSFAVALGLWIIVRCSELRDLPSRFASLSR